ISEATQDRQAELADHILIIHEENGFGTRAHGACGFCGIARRLPKMAWEKDIKSRPLLRLARAMNPATVLLDNSKHHGHAEPRSLAEGLGREERLENVLPHLIAHAQAGVLNAQADVLSWLSIHVGSQVLFIHDKMIRREGEFTSGGHGVAGIEAEI